MSKYDIDAIQRSTVIDSNGDKVGSVGQLYLDDATGEPNFVTVKTGLFGNNESFVPLEGAEITGDEIRVPYTKDHIKDAPNVAEDGHIDAAEEDQIHRFYAGGAAGAAGAAAGADGHAGAGADGGADGDAGADRGADGDAGADRGADGDAGADRGADGAAGVAGDRDGDSVVRREEEVNVGKERVETGRVRLRKHVVTDTKTVEVPVEREEVQVVREPIEGGNRGGDLSDDDVEVTLSEERPVVEKEVVDKERVGLDKNVVSDTERVQTDVGREEVEVVQDGNDVDRSNWSDADYEREGYKRDKDGSWLDKLGNKLDRDNDGKVGR